MDAKLHKKLSDRQEKGTLRSLSSFEGFVDFFSNDYLGVAKSSERQITVAGSTGSRLLSGNSKGCEKVEQQFAQFFDSEAALHFNSGYDANLGIFSTLPQKGDTILYDEFIHASVRDGVRLSWAKSFSFRHNDLEHLEERLKKAEGAIYVAIEALYSMDGDIAPLKEIAALCQRYGAYLIVDEAHSGGIFERLGRGLVSELDLTSLVFIRLMTFGKAYGSHGSIVLCSADTRQFLVNFCRPFIYSTALPVSVLEHNYKIASDSKLVEARMQLQKVIGEYHSCLNGFGIETNSSVHSPIQVIEVGDIVRTRELAEKLQSNRIAAKPIYSPTVPEGKERLRICLHAYNTPEEVDQLIQILNSKR
ncbi:MAG: aminotransferase class I/II-fold pyridoxal phosphate-dependent enzyme [Fluviicola sp.]